MKEVSRVLSLDVTLLHSFVLFACSKVLLRRHHIRSAVPRASIDILIDC
jgi:hypothetical protein